MNDWKQILARSFGGHDQSHSPLLVEIEAKEERVRARVNGEGLTFLDSSDGAGPDLAIRLSDLSIEDLLLKRADSLTAFRDTQVSAGGEWSAPLPAAETEMLEGAEFEAVPGATFAIVFLIGSTMFGDICRIERWEDGRPVATETIPPSQFEEAAVDLRFTCTLAQLAALRRGEITPPDAFAAGAVLKSDWPYMSAWVDLLQHDAFAEAYAGAPAVDPQISWGEILSSPAYGEAANQAQNGQPSPA